MMLRLLLCMQQPILHEYFVPSTPSSTRRSGVARYVFLTSNQTMSACYKSAPLAHPQIFCELHLQPRLLILSSSCCQKSQLLNGTVAHVICCGDSSGDCVTRRTFVAPLIVLAMSKQPASLSFASSCCVAVMVLPSINLCTNARSVASSNHHIVLLSIAE